MGQNIDKEADDGVREPRKTTAPNMNPEPKERDIEVVQAVAVEEIMPNNKYDVILRCKPSDLCRDKYWEVEFPDTTVGDSVLKKKTQKSAVAIGILGNFNRGKTWIMSRLCQCDLPDQGNTVKTEGLSLKWIEPSDESPVGYVIIDSAGINSPIDLLEGKVQLSCFFLYFSTEIFFSELDATDEETKKTEESEEDESEEDKTEESETGKTKEGETEKDKSEKDETEKDETEDGISLRFCICIILKFSSRLG